jgi:hypothetical protein
MWRFFQNIWNRQMSFNRLIRLGGLWFRWWWLIFFRNVKCFVNFFWKALFLCSYRSFNLVLLLAFLFLPLSLLFLFNFLTSKLLRLFAGQSLSLLLCGLLIRIRFQTLRLRAISLWQMGRIMNLNCFLVLTIFLLKLLHKCLDTD